MDINELEKFTKPVKKRGSKKLAAFLAGIGIVGVAGTGIYFSGILNKVKVSYTFNGQETVVAHFYKVGINEIVAPETPKGYKFAGWFKDANYTVRVAADEVFKSNTTIYPLFIPRTYGINYFSNDGTGSFYVDGMPFNSTHQVQDRGFERDRYELLGYSYDSNLNYATDNDKIIRIGDNISMTSEGVDLYAVWRGQYVTVNIDMTSVVASGQPIGNLSWPARYGELFSLPNLVNVTHATDSNKIFGGYIINGVVYNAGETSNAITETNSINVTVNWIENPMLYVTITNPETKAVSQIAYQGDNLDSVHYYDLATAIDTQGKTLAEELELLGLEHNTATSILDEITSVDIDANYSTNKYCHVLNVQFTAEDRTIELYNGETLVDTLNVKYGDVVELPRLFDNEKSYLGYSTESYTGIHPEYVGKIAVNFDEEVTKLYVNWRTPKVYINANGGVGSVDVYEIPAGETFTFSQDQIDELRTLITRKYYTLVGLSSDSTASTGSFSITTQEDDVTIVLFAVWERNKSTITFTDAEEGSTLPLPVQIDEGSYYTLSADGFSKVGHYLTGFTYNGETYAIGDQVFVESDSAISPIWCQYQISFVGGGNITSVALADGTECGVQDLQGGELIVAPNCARADGSTMYDYKEINGVRYYFAGWSKNENATVPTYFINDTIINYDEEITLYAVYMPATEGLQYTSNGDDTYYISLTNDDDLEISGGVLVLPSVYTLNGNTYPVVSIEQNPLLLINSSVSNFEHVVIGQGIESVGSYAVKGNSNLTNITLPDSVSNVAWNAFYGCSGFEKFVVSTDNSYYSSISGVLYNKTQTEIVRCPEGIEVNSIVLPNTITSIGERAFYGCSGVASITTPDCLTSIGTYAFSGCTSLSGFVIGDNVTSIGTYAFSGCTSLTSVDIPVGVEVLSENAFSGCTSLASLTLHSALIEIKSNAFQNCALTSVDIPSSVTNIDSTAFKGCLNLTSINASDDNANFSTQTGVLYNKDKTELLICPAGIINIVVPGTVTQIGASAFEGCSRLASVTMQEGLELIGNGAFSGCTSITSVVVPGSVEEIGTRAFMGCTGLTVLVLQEGIGTIGNSAFNGCTGLTSVTIPSSATFPNESLSSLAQFAGCTSLTNVSISSNCFGKIGKLFYRLTGLNITVRNDVTSIGNSAFKSCTGISSVALPNTIESIGSEAFSGCTAITSISVPSGVTSVGAHAFNGCIHLESVTFGSGSLLETIGSYSFSGCTLLTDINIPSGVTSIGDSAFYSCANLASVTFATGSLLETIGGNAFSGCRSLSSFTIGDNVTTIGSGAFSNCRSITNIIIPNSVTSVGDYAFSGCTNLESVTFGSGIKAIASGTFSGCTSLNNVVIPNTVNSSIGNSAFSGCTSLANLTIGSNVTSIGERAFKNCTALTSVVIPYKVDSIGDYAFYYCTNLASVELSVLDSGVSGYSFNIYDCVDSIGDYAFAYCSSLTSITLPGRMSVLDNYIGVTTISQGTFKGCSSIANVNMSVVSTIETSAFEDCTSLVSINMPSTVRAIAENAFKGCANLVNVTMPGDVKRGGVGSQSLLPFSFSEAFPNLTGINLTILNGTTTINSGFANSLGIVSVNIPNSVTTYAVSAFDDSKAVFGNCHNLRDVTIPASCFGIFDEVFAGCSNLEVTIQDGVTEITNQAFAFCQTIASIVLSSSVTSIANGAFADTQYVYTITLNEGLLSIGDDAFYRSGITSIVIPSSVTTFGDYIFYESELRNVTISENCFGELYKFTPEYEINVTIQNGVTAIANDAFMNSSYIATVTIPTSVVSIGDNAFKNCTNLTSVTFDIPFGTTSSLQTIGDSAFAGCSSLTFIGNLLGYSSLPDTLTSIADYAFSGCTSLSSIVIPTSVTTIGSHVFEDSTIVYARATSRQSGWASDMGGDVKWYSEEKPPKNLFPGRYWHFVYLVPTVWS